MPSEMMNDFTQCFATLFVGVINHLSCYDVDSCVTTFLVEVMSMLSFYPNWYKPSTDYHFFFFFKYYRSYHASNWYDFKTL